MNEERFKKQRDFILEVDKEKNIYRQTHLTGHGRNEGDAEHAWHMALMAYLLGEYANEKIDLAKTMAICLIHDIVEIDAGDTYAYDEEAKKSQAEREAKAAERIFGLLPHDQKEKLKALFYEFENRSSPEAKFARVLDNLQPILLNVSNDGSDWKAHGVRAEQVRDRNKNNKDGSLELASFIEDLIFRQKEKGNLK